MTKARIASPGTLLGMLQRGRGRGYLESLQAPGEEVAADLVECLTHDPRLDFQVESRSFFYARLAAQIGMDLSPIRAHLFSAEDDSDPDERRAGLALDTLKDLGRIGNSAAISLLRRYVEVGSNWMWALDGLVEIGTSEALRGLDGAVAGRCPTDDDLVGVLSWYRLEEPPWNEWRMSNPRMDHALAVIEAEGKSSTLLRKRVPNNTAGLLQPSGHMPAQFGALKAKSTAELLQLSEWNTWPILKDRTSPADVTLLLAAALDGRDGARSAALIALGEQNNAAVLEAAELAVRNGSNQVARAGGKAILSLSSDSVVTKARGWLTEAGHLGDAAVHILSERGTAEDLPALIDAWERARSQDNVYSLSSLVDGFGRLRAESAAPLVEVIFVETTYSYLRGRAAEALSDISPRFPRRLAIECLWDCEEGTRALGAAVAWLEAPRVRDRLAELSADVVEGKYAREAATHRIQSRAH